MALPIQLADTQPVRLPDQREATRHLIEVPVLIPVAGSRRIRAIRAVACGWTGTIVRTGHGWKDIGASQLEWGLQRIRPTMAVAHTCTGIIGKTGLMCAATRGGNEKAKQHGIQIPATLQIDSGGSREFVQGRVVGEHRAERAQNNDREKRGKDKCRDSGDRNPIRNTMGALRKKQRCHERNNETRWEQRHFLLTFAGEDFNG